jgi:predicted NAD-dependent protein-ADP-ribosyltransferase YbiA (DUF1768 family)
MIFAIGDSSKTFVNGQAGATEEEGDILRSVFGRVNPIGPVPPFVSRVGKGMLKDGADVVACMFALHYFFKDSESLAGFMTNLNDSIKLGGYFVACFFDGQRVFDLLKDKEVGEAATGVEAGAPIWSIKKNYDEEELPDDEMSLGMGIDVEFISIGASHTEYLVSFELLKTKMREIGCYLEDPANDTALFDDSYKVATQKGNQFPMSDVVKQYSFLNRWVVFRRKTSGQVFQPVTPPFGEVVEGHVPPEGYEPLPQKGDVWTVATGWVKPGDARYNEATGLAAPLEAAEEPRTSAAVAIAAASSAAAVTTSGPAAPIVSGGPVAVIDAQPSLASAIASASASVEGVVPNPKEKTVASGPAAKYESSEVFRFAPDAKLVDTLKIGDKQAVRWLAPYSPFPIIDALPSGGQVKYPTLEHYLVGMKYKIATDKPQLAASVFSEEGTIHQKFLRDRLAASGKKAITEEQDQEFLRLEMVEVRNANRASNIKKFKAQFDEATWAAQKDAVLKEGLKQRWDRDARLHTIVEAARAQGKYLLYDSDSAAAGELAGVRKADGRIEGENKVGRILMQLAGYPGF